MQFNAKEAQQRMSSNPDFINLMRAICKITGWNTVLPDRVSIVEKTSIDGKISKEVVRQEVPCNATINKYNGKREVWHNIRTLLCFSPETLAKIEQGATSGEKIK